MHWAQTGLSTSTGYRLSVADALVSQKEKKKRVISFGYLRLLVRMTVVIFEHFLHQVKGCLSIGGPGPKNNMGWVLMSIEPPIF